ncbi:uncharacterized protein HMPREF1541_06438 [Cyphellophora europaea CBS 101466]|uniref:Anaphase-promoting complex subunit 4 WD40 domain-containing protein n=1 Tax=Cyphellophora europaea (strain CBS 101466) TaxID=1220924 RepID=W2RRQ5_CYPE1|nr:uncharacterized protein HMPREF1541_06438 [Cyphellophora europaea CBS 101466]ETN38403.1 hypothetical protein HMPREF1541_06438 [Cyphellophora europaea CBS 101466]
MPFHTPRHSYSLSDASPSHDNYYAATNAIYSAGQTVNSVGSPTSNWGQKQQQQQQNNYFPSDQHPYQLPQPNGNGMTIPYRAAPPPNAASNQAPHEPHSSQYLHSRRTSTLSGQGHDLHLPQSGGVMSDVHHYGAPPSYASDNVSINVLPSTPGHPPPSAPMPGSLQPGGQGARPQMLSSNSAAPQLPSLPNLPQISTQMQQQQQQQQQQRPATINHTHSYSRSSPGLMEQTKYKPFTSTPEQNKYGSPANYVPHTPQGPPSYSPLGLADIRPRADTTLSDNIPFSPPLTQDTDIMQYPTTSNYVAQWPMYAADWCKWPPRSNTGAVGKVAIGSYLEDSHNYIQVLDASVAQPDPDNPMGDPGFEFTKTAEATHAYPVTRILWEPPSSNKQTTDLLATSGDHLRLWSLPADPTASYSSSISRKDHHIQKLSPLALLSNSKSPEHTAPITSLDWNVVQPSLIITSSIDTTCTIWDIPTLTAKTQLIAHDKEVYDVRFCANSVDVFVSCGADGSVRMFDLRSLEHSTIIYEPSEKNLGDKNSNVSPENLSSSPTRSGPSALANPPPLLRIAASPNDAHLLATFSQDSSVIRVLDVRQPGQALLELKGHAGPVNCIEWSNTQRGLLASGGDDCCVLLWDLMTAVSNNTGVTGMPAAPGTQQVAGGTAQGQGTGQERGPSATWECGFEVSNLTWAPSQGALGVCGGRGFWGVLL